jgi:hypothetical protein
MNLIPTKQLNLAIPLPLYTKLVFSLTSELEGRVPHGEFSRFFSELLRSHFEDTRLDLAHWLPAGIPTNAYIVRGDFISIQTLKERLK